MKKLLRGVALALVAIMLLSTLIACKKDEVEETPTNTVAVDSENAVYFKVPQTNWDKDFNILTAKWAMYNEYFFYNEGIEQGDIVNDALFERTNMVNDHLGVRVKHDIVGDGDKDFKTSYEKLQNAIMAGDESYHLYLTHVYQYVTTIVGAGYAHDLSDTDLFPDIQLKAPYWNKDAMDELSIGGALYFGHNDYMLSDPNAVFFNKKLSANYQITDPYQMVKDGTWTLENMNIEAAKVSPDSGHYGFATIADWQFLSFLDSCETGIIVDEGGWKTLDMSPSNERYSNVYDMIEELCVADSTYLYNDGEVRIPEEEYFVTGGKVLFSLAELSGASRYRQSSEDFGILPYPKYDTEQTEYHSFDWSGFMCVPINVQSTEMVGQVLECLASFSANTVHIAYYEKLLGGKIADKAEDYEMLQLIFDTVCTNPAINYMNGIDSGSGLNTLIYAYRRLAYAYAKGTTPTSVTTDWGTHSKSAQAAIDSTLNS